MRENLSALNMTARGKRKKSSMQVEKYLLMLSCSEHQNTTTWFHYGQFRMLSKCCLEKEEKGSMKEGN